MATATYSHFHPTIDRGVAALVALVIAAVAIAATVGSTGTAQVEPQRHFLEIDAERTPAGLSFETP